VGDFSHTLEKESEKHISMSCFCSSSSENDFSSSASEIYPLKQCISHAALKWRVRVLCVISGDLWRCNGRVGRSSSASRLGAILLDHRLRNA
jgi:hypothetical protein